MPAKLPPPPRLTAQQQELVDEVAAAWRAEGVWPSRQSWHVRYFKRGLVLDEIIASMPDDVIHVAREYDPTLRLKLTIVGFELAHDGSREVAPFLDLVKLAASRFIADRRGKPTVTHVDLAAILGADDRQYLDRLGTFYREAWGLGGSNLDGTWLWTLSVYDVRLEHVASAWEFYQLRETVPRYNIAPLEEVHRDLVRAIYTAWREQGEWPDTVDVIVDERHRGDVLALLAEIPDTILWQQSTHGATGERYRLRLDGVALAAPGEEPELFVRVLRAICNHYLVHEGVGTPSIEDIASVLHVPESDVRRVAQLFVYEHTGISSHEYDGTVTINMNESALQWEGVRTYAEYVRKRDELYGWRSSIRSMRSRRRRM